MSKNYEVVFNEDYSKVSENFNSESKYFGVSLTNFINLVPKTLNKEENMMFQVETSLSIAHIIRTRNGNKQIVVDVFGAFGDTCGLGLYKGKKVNYQGYDVEVIIYVDHIMEELENGKSRIKILHLDGTTETLDFDRKEK